MERRNGSTPGLNTTNEPAAPIRSVQSENRSAHSPVQELNTTILTTTDESLSDWYTSPETEAKDTDKRIEIRYNKRKNKEPYGYWVSRWPAKDKDGNPIKRPSGTYVRKYEYGGRLATIKDVERLARYKPRN